MRNIVFELCAESLDACLVAEPGGAHRIELCSALSEGGVTPSHGLIREAIASSGLPVHVLLRPRSGNFVYTAAEFIVMQEDLSHIRALGARGVALGILHPDGSVDLDRTRALVQQAGPLEVTFHRAFDHAAPLDRALEDVIATGCARILTSGGEPDVTAGSASLRRLVQQAAGRIQIAAGGGLRLENAAEVARATGATHFHGSIRTSPSRHADSRNPAESSPAADSVGSIVAPEDIRTVVANLVNA